MASRSAKLQPDKIFLGIVIALVAVGLLIFVSAALSRLAENPPVFYRMLTSQLVLGFLGGVTAGYVAYRIPYEFWKKYALYFLIGAVLLMGLLFVPSLAMTHGGATRWVSLGPITFQPADILKVAFVIYFAAWLSYVKEKVDDYRFGLLPLGILFGLTGGLLLVQPDTGTFLVIIAAGVSMFFVAGARWKDIAIIIAVGVVGSVALVAMRPYLLDRIMTFVDPSRDPLGSSYQIQQSMIALGSGRVWGRGYGQSVQKFDYLPEPAGDAVFAVAGEEIGFIGLSIILMLYILFAVRGIWIARRTPDLFSGLLIFGIVILVIAQSFLNIAAVIGVFPLTGLPLIFMSHGGTALMISLFTMGIVLGISRKLKSI